MVWSSMYSTRFSICQELLYVLCQKHQPKFNSIDQPFQAEMN